MCVPCLARHLFNDASIIIEIVFIYFIEREFDKITQYSIPPNSRSGEGVNFVVAGNQTVTSQMGSQCSAY